MATNELKSSSTRSPRFSTSRALGFRGGAIGRSGNLEGPTFQQLEGTVPPAPIPATPTQPAIAQFNATVPKGPSLAGTLGTAAASAAASEGLKKAGGYILDKIKRPPMPPAQLPPLETPEDLGYDVAYEGLGTASNLAGDLAGGAYDFGSAAEIYSGLGEGVEAAGGGIPYLGPALNLAQGNPEAALLSGIGYAIAGPIGGFIGGMIGGDDEACFITEAVMAAGGQGDTAPELRALRQFRDQVLSATPQGQGLIQEYEAIAPVVVEGIMRRPDALQVFQAIDAQFINPAVDAINQGDFQKAIQIYAQMIAFVTPYAAESAGAQGSTSPALMDMQKMGERAAMLGYDPEMAGVATMDMGMMDQDPTGYDGGPQMPSGGAPMMTPEQNPMMEQFAKPRY